MREENESAAAVKVLRRARARGKRRSPDLLERLRWAVTLLPQQQIPHETERALAGRAGGRARPRCAGRWGSHSRSPGVRVTLLPAAGKGLHRSSKLLPGHRG